jgi:hypothetical protein
VKSSLSPVFRYGENDRGLGPKKGEKNQLLGQGCGSPHSCATFLTQDLKAYSINHFHVLKPNTEAALANAGAVGFGFQSDKTNMP